MEKKLFYYMNIGSLFTVLSGIFSNFAFSFSGQNVLVGMFCPVNNSPWEMIKIIFFPSLLYLLSGWYYFYKYYPAFMRSCFTGLLAGSFFFLVFFYTFTGISGYISALFIIIFLLGASCLIYYFSYEFIIQHYAIFSMPLLATIVVTVLVFFFSFTFTPPNLPLFSPLIF